MAPYKGQSSLFFMWGYLGIEKPAPQMQNELPKQ